MWEKPVFYKAVYLPGDPKWEGAQFLRLFHWERSDVGGFADRVGPNNLPRLQTATLYSRRASFSEVFLSVLSLRFPMIRAQET